MTGCDSVKYSNIQNGIINKIMVITVSCAVESFSPFFFFIFGLSTEEDGGRPPGHY